MGLSFQELALRRMQGNCHTLNKGNHGTVDWFKDLRKRTNL